MHDEVDLAFELKFDNLCTGLFMRKVVEEARYEWVEDKEWSSDAISFLDQLNEVPEVEPIASKREIDIEACVFYLRGSLVYLQLWRGQVLLRIAGPLDKASEAEALAKTLVPEAVLDDRVSVKFWFWARNRGLARSLKRLLSVPEWNEISGNYPSATRHRVDGLIRDGIVPAAGQLVIWFGEAGVGKTYALRALLREWQTDFNLHYISDAETFFTNSEYMMSVLLEDEGAKWKLFILEDSGEFLLPDARQQMGQGLSRLLNASDGLIGQGLKAMFLITTNEAVSRLHPAVSRPGRCASQIEFASFPPEEARHWLGARGEASVSLHSPAKLAELYAALRGESLGSGSVKVGFQI